MRYQVALRSVEGHARCRRSEHMKGWSTGPDSNRRWGVRPQDLQSRAFDHLATSTRDHSSWKKAGAGSRARTDDLLITNQLLYRLSYPGMSQSCAASVASMMTRHAVTMPTAAATRNFGGAAGFLTG